MAGRVTSIAANAGGFPPPNAPEIAFAGRSNCGKSSLINALLGQRIARTSSQPGRTQQLIFIEAQIPKSAPFIVVDLPGYGYAKASNRAQKDWNALVTTYLSSRQSLRALVLISDIRRRFATEEIQVVEWAAQYGVGLVAVLNKADKLNKSARRLAVEQARSTLPKSVALVACSASTRLGIDHLQTQITHWVENKSTITV